ncbi:hypothetical protein Hanom_Chr17g01590091 [Helianthus anomalus]
MISEFWVVIMSHSQFYTKSVLYMYVCIIIIWDGRINGREEVQFTFIYAIPWSD